MSHFHAGTCDSDQLSGADLTSGECLAFLDAAIAQTEDALTRNRVRASAFAQVRNLTEDILDAPWHMTQGKKIFWITPVDAGEVCNGWHDFW